jgi:uncharacterized protein (DUF934 family)
MRQIFENGDIANIQNAAIKGALTIPAETEQASLKTEHYQAQELILEFSNSADGRGFSLARVIKRVSTGCHSLHASGPLLPDQLSMAWDCGFDSVLVTDEHFARCGSDTWQRLA